MTQSLHPQGVSWLGTTWQQVTQWVPGIASSITPLLVAGLILTLPKDSGSEETSVAEDPMIKLGAISPTFSQSYPNQIQVPAYAPMIDTTGHPAAPVPPATPTMTEPTLPASPSAPVAPSPDSPTLQVLSGTLLLPDFPDEDDWLSRLMPPKLPALPVEELLPSLPPLPPLPALPELEPLAGLTHQPSEPSPSSKPSRPSRPSRASGQSLQLGQVLSGWLSSKHEPEQSVVADQNVPAEPVTRLESEVATEEGNIDALKRQLWRHLLDDELIKNKRGLSLFTFKEGGFQFNGEEVPGHLKEHYFELFDEWGEMHSPKEGDSARHPFIRENGVVALHPQFIAVGRITTEGFFGAMSGTLDMMEVESWGVKALPPEQ
ncbi:MAG TPA: hypothetical protein DCP28_20535 [Cytophagales bacterium]|nr:hypothetical protein [Cytophagales bacterium]